MAKRGRGHSRTKQREQRQMQLIFGSVALVVFAIIAAIAYTFLTAPPDIPDDRLKALPSEGAAEPVVRVLEIGSYGCTVCRTVYDQGLVQNILAQYGDRVQFTFQNFPLPASYPNDPMVAEIAQCAFDQGNDAFWTMHNAIYELTHDEYTEFEEEDFIALADEKGLDADAIQTCMDEDARQKAVDYWEKDSQRRTDGTPTFFVNGQRVPNYNQLEAAVNAALNG
jgi:protein-disulfide isomerase